MGGATCFEGQLPSSAEIQPYLVGVHERPWGFPLLEFGQLRCRWTQPVPQNCEPTGWSLQQPWEGLLRGQPFWTGWFLLSPSEEGNRIRAFCTIPSTSSCWQRQTTFLRWALGVFAFPCGGKAWFVFLPAVSLRAGKDVMVGFP